VAVAGYSYGGYQACWLPTRSDRFARAVAGGAPTDLASELATSDAAGPVFVHEIGATPEADPARYVERSPLTHVESVNAPTLIFHGADDHRVPLHHAEQWFVRLRMLRRPVELVVYPGASHLFIVNGRPSHRVDLQRRVVEFLRPLTAPSG
jgi:dipeptidyl aminopeptidase/acylaminoacyl peptidase